MSASILSIQSWVAYGHVGNAAAMFPLQRLGFETWGVHTVQFSNHTGYGAWRGRVMDAAWISDVVRGIEERGGLVGCAAGPEARHGESALQTLTPVTSSAPEPTCVEFACEP